MCRDVDVDVATCATCGWMMDDVYLEMLIWISMLENECYVFSESVF